MTNLIKFFISFLIACNVVNATDIIIDQKNKTFLPGSVNAKVGDRLIFKNSDGFAHNAYSDNEKNEFDIGMQRPNQDVIVELQAPASLDIECAIHPNMLLKVKVK